MTKYENDTTASAVILLKDAETRFIVNELTGFQFEYTLKMKIKILKNESLEWCDQLIYYYELDKHNREKEKTQLTFMHIKTNFTA